MVKRVKTSLSLALDHANICNKGVAAYAPFCVFSPGWLVGYDGVVASGYRIVEDLWIAPHTETMRNALAKAGTPFSLTQLASGNVVVTGDKVRVEVPCNSMDAMPNVVPDAARHEIAEPFCEALCNVASVTTARHARVIAASVFIIGDSAIGTDGGTILEAYHGMGLPGPFLVPTEFAIAVEKVKHKPTHIGWSDATLTVWYGPNCWLRTNIYTDSYPDTDVMFARMLSHNAELRPIPTEMLGALMRIKPFLEDDTITLWAGGFNTKFDGTGASSHFDHHLIVPQPLLLPFATMVYAATWGQWLSFSKDGMYWYGQRVRGATAAAR